MAQQDDTGRSTALLAPATSSLDAALDGATEPLSIFSAPALEVVFTWWAESNRRWTERNGAKALIVPTGIRPEA